MNPKPKINIGSRIALMIAMQKITMLGVRPSPVDLNEALDITIIPKKGAPINQIFIYCFIRGKLYSSAPRTLKSGSEIEKPITETKIVKPKIRKIIFPIINFALSFSPEPMNLEIVAETPIAIPILKLIIVNNTGKEKDIAASSITPNLPM
tara:strand:+ start:1038 stop:1490 length:453 start_codon:yes stop_codon:yes gene_type:complete